MTNTDTTLPFVKYIREDKSKYTTATKAGYRDIDRDFLVGESGGFLFNVDFVFVDTYLLRPAANSYEKYGYYTDLPDDSPPHRRFRIQEEIRRKSGITAKCKLLVKDKPAYDRLMLIDNKVEAKKLVKSLHITGEHYNFINYGIISKLDEASVTVSKTGKVSGVKVDGIPIFFGSQYWWYKSKEFARYNGFHLIVGKSRRAGFSYMEAVGSANTVNLNPFCTVIHAGSELKYLTEGRSISRMSMMQLEHYEANTPFNRGMISRKITDIHLGFKNKSGANDGYQSHLLSLVTGTSNPDVAIGKDAIEIKCEELSVFETFDDFMDVTEPTTRTGSVVTGSIVAWGTGGSKDGKWEVFERNFYNPYGYNFMPFENIWDKDSRDRVCGFYKPYVDSLQGFTPDGRIALDKDGNTNYEIAMEISRIEREAFKKKSKSIADYILHCGQYSNMPSESFSSTVDNMFASEALNAHINDVRHNPDYKFYTDGMIVNTVKGVKFKSNFKLHDEGVKTHPFIEDVPPRAGVDKYGCIRVFHHPFRDKHGKVPDIYHMSYDPVGMDKDNPNSKDSYNSISVWMNPNIYMPHVRKLKVATYFGRPKTMEEADNISLMMALLYGGHTGILLAEIDRGETKSNYRKWGYTKLLDKEPVVVWDTKIKVDTPANYGIKIGNDIRKLQGLRLLSDMLYEETGEDDKGNTRYVLHTIPDLPFLLEIQKWHNDGNFDRVSEAIIEAFAHKKLHVLAKIKLKTRKRLKESIMTRDWF